MKTGVRGNPAKSKRKKKVGDIRGENQLPG